METIQKSPIQLFRDEDYEEDAGSSYGRYLGTYLSDRGQVRADIFDADPEINAYISFPTGLDGSNVEDRYVNELYSYAAAQGFRDRFHMLYVE